ncbi:MAG: TOBE domain-containing protein [Gemmatimonadota bacterium]
MSASEVAAILHLNVKRVQSLARAGKLPAVRVGRKWLFSRRRVEALLHLKAEPDVSHSVELSARNQLRGRIVGVQVAGVMAEVKVQIGDQELVSVITSSSVKRLHLKKGDEVFAVIKSTEVMIGKG